MKTASMLNHTIVSSVIIFIWLITAQTLYAGHSIHVCDDVNDVITVYHDDTKATDNVTLKFCTKSTIRHNSVNHIMSYIMQSKSIKPAEELNAVKLRC